MVVIIQSLLCLALIFSSILHAQEGGSTQPDPASLEANWWNYFEPGEAIKKDQFNDQIKKYSVYLDQVLGNVNMDQRATLTPFVRKIQDGLRQYSALKQAPVSDEQTFPPLAEQYGIEEALERFVIWRKFKREIDLSNQDLEWQNAQLTMERKRQSQRRGEYLKLDVTDPLRLSKGLALMASRVNLELTSLQSKRRETKIKDAKVKLQRVEEELTEIHTRLVSIPAKTNWAIDQAKLKKKAEQIRQQVDESFDGQPPDTLLGSTNIKLMLLLATGKEIRASTYEVMAMRFQAMEVLDRTLASDAKDKVDHPPLKKVIQTFDEFKELIAAQLETWQSSTAQSRKFAAAQAENDATLDKVLTPALQRLLQQADENEGLLRELRLELDMSDFIDRLAQGRLKTEIGWFKNWLLTSGSWLENSWENVSGWLNTTLFEISETPVTSAGLLRVLIIISVALLISRLIRRGLARLGQRKGGVSSSALYTLGRVIHYIILVVGVIIGLSSIGIDFTKFALFASALGVGIGFGLQTLISNFVAGLIILFERSLKVGDFVELSTGLAGEVKEVNMRSTLITTNDNIDILVPNSEFVNNQVTNWTLREAQRRIHIPFGVAYGTDKELVKKAALEAADEVKWTLKDTRTRHPQVWFVEFGDSSLNFELVVWLVPEAVKRPGFVQANYLWEIDTKLRQYEIEVPFPQRDLHLRSVFGLKDKNELSTLKREL